MFPLRKALTGVAFAGALTFAGTAVQAAQAPDPTTRLITPGVSTTLGQTALKIPGLNTSPAGDTAREMKVAQRWRRRARVRNRARRRARRNFAIGAGALIVGAIIANEAAKANDRRRYDGYTARKRRCARDYRSFDWETETIITYEGREIVCPYLR